MNLQNIFKLVVLYIHGELAINRHTFCYLRIFIQIILIVGVFIISKLLPTNETDREFLEGIYKK